MKKHALKLSIIVITLAFILSGCAGIGKLAEVVTKTSDGGIKTSEGEIKTGDDLKWPSDQMGDLVKPDAKINSVITEDTTGTCIVAFSEMSQESAENYIEKLKEQGYEADVEMTDTEGIIFSGTNADGVTVTFAYTFSSKEGTISYVTAPSGTNGTNDTSEPAESDIDMTDASPWPVDFIPGVPELKGKITNVSNQNDESVSVDLWYVEKVDFEAYVETLKQNGYTVESDVFTDTEGYDFRAYNENGDWVNANLNYDSKTAYVSMEKAITE